MIVTTKQLFAHAYGQYALGAYNINNLEQTGRPVPRQPGQGPEERRADPTPTSAPFIIQISRGARSYSDKRFLEAMIRTAEAVFPEADLRGAPRPRHRRGFVTTPSTAASTAR